MREALDDPPRSAALPRLPDAEGRDRRPTTGPRGRPDARDREEVRGDPEDVRRRSSSGPARGRRAPLGTHAKNVSSARGSTTHRAGRWVRDRGVDGRLRVRERVEPHRPQHVARLRADGVDRVARGLPAERVGGQPVGVELAAQRREVAVEAARLEPRQEARVARAVARVREPDDRRAGPSRRRTRRRVPCAPGAGRGRAARRRPRSRDRRARAARTRSGGDARRPPAAWRRLEVARVRVRDAPVGDARQERPRRRRARARCARAPRGTALVAGLPSSDRTEPSGATVASSVSAVDAPRPSSRSAQPGTSALAPPDQPAR